MWKVMFVLVHFQYRNRPLWWCHNSGVFLHLSFFFSPEYQFVFIPLKDKKKDVLGKYVVLVTVWLVCHIGWQNCLSRAWHSELQIHLGRICFIAQRNTINGLANTHNMLWNILDILTQFSDLCSFVCMLVCFTICCNILMLFSELSVYVCRLSWPEGGFLGLLEWFSRYYHKIVGAITFKKIFWCHMTMNVAVEWLAHLLNINEVLVSVVGLQTYYNDWNISWAFPSSSWQIQGQKCMQRPLPSMTFPFIIYFILSFDAV